MSHIAANVKIILGRIKAAADRAGRDPSTITLVAVTKTHPVETIIEGYRTGLRHFGENRIFEKEKVSEMAQWLETQPETEPPTWHFIGHLQRRQAGEVLETYQLIHSVDSLKLAERLNRLAQRDNLPPVEVFLQGNVSGETAKSGFELSDWSSDKQQLQAFIETVSHIATLQNVVIRGLMTMAPIVDDPETVRPVFRSLAGLHKRLQQELPYIDWRHLSMGMTDDFEVAIEEGATMIRVGRAIFGERRIITKR